MLKQILPFAAAAFALAVAAVPAGAQEPQYSPPPAQNYELQSQPAPQTSQACVRLESQLASLDSQRGANPQQQSLEASYNQQRSNLDALIAKSRGMGCGRNFLFGPRPPAECRGLQSQIDRMEDQTDRLEEQLRRGRGDPGLREAQRRDLIAALAQNQCGPQYQAAAPQGGGSGLFGLLFGSRGGGIRETYPSGPAEIPQTSTFRTVCVRTCDGFFFPVSYSTVPSRFGQDDNMCRRTCPGAEAVLFSYPNPGGTIEQATSTSGQAYTQLPNAFKYQTEFVKGCSCKPEGKSWTEALAGADDDTLQRGDIVVDEERARRMSQPAGAGGAVATPDEAARAAQDSAGQTTGEGYVENPANTDPPVGFPQQPVGDSARTAEPYYVPPPKQQRPDPRYLPPQFR